MPIPAVSFALRSTLATALAGIALAAHPCAQSVLVVGAVPGPGVEYVDLQKAVMEAPSGSTLLLRGGDHGGFFLGTSNAKTLHLVADVGATPTLTVPSIVLNLSAEHALTLRGIDFRVNSSTALTISGCKGPVWIEDGQFDSSAANLPTAVHVRNSPAVAFVRTNIIGPIRGRALIARGEPGTPTTVSLFDCDLRGGKGFEFENGGLNGGPGLRLDGAQVLPSGSVIRGGDGYSYDHPLVGCLSGKGGDGVEFLAGAYPNELVLLASSLHGGAGANLCGGPPIDGVPFAGPGSVMTLVGSPRELLVNSPVREGESALLQFAGASGELAVLALGKPSIGFGAATWGELLAPVLVGAPLSTFVAGFLPQSGVLVNSIQIQELGLGIEGYALHAQPAFVSIGGASAQLGAPTQIVILEQTL
jgi:hypothetical protein